MKGLGYFLGIIFLVAAGFCTAEEAGVELKPLPTNAKAQEPEVVQSSAATAAALNDGQLLELFKTPEDAMRVRDRKLKDLDTAMGFLQTRLNLLTTQQKSKMAEAAELEFNGKSVPQSTVKAFLDLSDQVAQAKTDLANKQQEKTSVAAEYDNNIQRLKHLIPIHDAPINVPTP